MFILNFVICHTIIKSGQKAQTESYVSYFQNAFAFQNVIT